jgi:hypothetical protein
MGLQIASFTYGGLLSLFILSKMKREFSPASIAIGLVFSILTVLVLKYFGLAWTWYIVFAVIVNICITYILDNIIKYSFKLKL